MSHNVIALVLAGGNTAGFGVLTRNRAKAALTFAGHYRVCDFVLSNLSNSGISDVGLLIQYLPGSLIAHVGTGRWWDLDGVGRTLKVMPPFMGVRQTEWFKGTADSVYRNLDFIEDSNAQHVLVLSCEHIYNLNYSEFIQQHIERGAAISMVTTNVPSRRLSSRFGYIHADPATGRVVDLVEKPKSPLGDLPVFTGITLYRRDVLVPALMATSETPEATHNLTRDVILPRIKSMPCYAHHLDGYWDYLENIGHYHDAHIAMATGAGPIAPGKWGVMTNLEYRQLGSLSPAYYSHGAQVTDSIVSPGSRILGRVTRSVLSPGVVVEEDAVVEDCILLNDVRVGRGAILKRVVSDKDAHFGEACTVGGGPDVPPGINPELPMDHRQLVVVGKGARIARNLRVGPAVQLYPGCDTESLGITEAIVPGSNIQGLEPRWPGTDVGRPIARDARITNPA